MGLFSRTTNGSTWRAHVRIEKNGEIAEYKDLVSTSGHVATAEEIKKAVISQIVRHSPHLNGGRVTRSAIRRVR
ncbi:hypothetical protein [Streptomyces griseorubiginosus]|uniref:hypothetical protein n=1 Tax=Streptomyces griseorubiginosus TaxID=67304 RepID=UPI0033FF827E